LFKTAGYTTGFKYGEAAGWKAEGISWHNLLKYKVIYGYPQIYLKMRIPGFKGPRELFTEKWRVDWGVMPKREGRIYPALQYVWGFPV
jgi:hypothetical protein